MDDRCDAYWVVSIMVRIQNGNLDAADGQD